MYISLLVTKPKGEGPRAAGLIEEEEEEERTVGRFFGSFKLFFRTVSIS